MAQIISFKSRRLRKLHKKYSESDTDSAGSALLQESLNSCVAQRASIVRSQIIFSGSKPITSESWEMYLALSLNK